MYRLSIAKLEFYSFVDCFSVRACHTHKRRRLNRDTSIGKVSTNGDLIVMELDDSALGKNEPFRSCRSHPALDSGAFRLSRGDWGAAVGCGLRP